MPSLIMKYALAGCPPDADGFKQLVGSNAANMELLCRGMTFYGSVITSAVIILIGYIIRKKRAK